MSFWSEKKFHCSCLIFQFPYRPWRTDSGFFGIESLKSESMDKGSISEIGTSMMAYEYKYENGGNRGKACGHGKGPRAVVFRKKLNETERRRKKTPRIDQREYGF